MTSLASKLMPFIISLTGAKRILGSAETTRAHVAELQLRPASYGPPKSLDSRVELSVRRYGGWPVYEVRPRGTALARRVIYPHGGAWILEITSFHWNFIADMVSSTGIPFLVPIYPLAPVGMAAEVIPIVADLTAQACEKVGPAHTYLMGDSAGGTTALAAAMQLRDRGIAPLGNVMLISPAIDLHFTDPAIAPISPRDPILDIPGVEVAAGMWRGQLSLDDPIVSPAFGNLRGLGPMTLFSGTYDMAHPDAVRLVALAKAANVSLDYHEARKMLHVYPLFPIPEAREAKRVMKAILLR
ncbi:alpha/beta hydrolase [Variovorax rhizosphaerae]|uniref:Alpha/beta hydrolase n=1 Tax=Variovorax rhizosphaerae TaxID=1836200 RepID=A0ABU8WMJ9_9BURK